MAGPATLKESNHQALMFPDRWRAGELPPELEGHAICATADKIKQHFCKRVLDHPGKHRDNQGNEW